MAINDDIYSKNLKRRVLLTMYENNLSEKLDKILIKHNINLQDIAGSTAKYNTTLKLRINNEIRRAYKEVYRKASDELNTLYGNEVKFNERTLQSALGPIYEVKQTAKNVTIRDLILRDNKTLGEHITSISLSERRKITSIIREGIANSIGTDAIIREIKNTGTSLSRSQISTLARTSITDVTNEAGKEVYKNNDDVLDGYQYVATLDDRTTPICARLDGQIFSDYDRGPRPPQHFNCRSTTIPVVKSIDDIEGLDSSRVDKGAIDDLSDRKRASINGQVPARTTYGEWLQGQDDETKETILGKDKVDLFNKGQLPINKFITPKGNEVSLERVEELSKDISPIFGNKNKWETDALELAYGNERNEFTKAISKLTPINANNFVKQRSRAYYNYQTDNLHLTNLQFKNWESIQTLGHEYGHRIDWQNYKLAQNTSKVNIITKGLDVKNIEPAFNGYDKAVSRYAGASILEDRILLSKNVKSVSTDYAKERYDFINSKFDQFLIPDKKQANRLIVDYVKLDKDLDLSKEINSIFSVKSFPIDKNGLKEIIKAEGKFEYSEKGINGLKVYDQLVQIKYKQFANRSSPIANIVKYGYYSADGKTLNKIWGRDILSSSFADYIGAITNNKLGYGHSEKYYNGFGIVVNTFRLGIKTGRITTGHTVEAFAQYSSLLGKNDKASKVYRKLFDYYAPNTTKAFDQLYKNIGEL